MAGNEPWNIMACSPEQEQIMYREWGLFYTKKQNLDVADLYYNKSLTLNPDDPKALYFRSRCKRSIAQTADALLDAERAMALDPKRQPFNLEVCDGLYELNSLETTKCQLSNFSRKFTGKKVDAFNMRIDGLNENFKDSLGDTLGYFILENGKNFNKAYQEMVQERSIDYRPLWKILKEDGKCDVLSVLEIEPILLSPREIARRNRGFGIFNQIYLGRSWVDALFLKALTKNESLLLPQSQWSRPIAETLTKTKYDIVMTLLKMLNARCPLYTAKLRNCPSRRRKKKQVESFLFRIQYQVHRSMLKMLCTMRQLRAQRRPSHLRKYVEEVMGEYVMLKTHRVMPWKFQFTNEVYNILALALCDQYKDSHRDLSKVDQKDRLIVFLRLDTDVEKEPKPFEFGNRATHENSEGFDKNWVYKALAARLEKRLKFAKYPIEKAYIWHEIARCDLKQNRFDRCCLIAERAITEAELCNSSIWMFHGTMMICKTHALLRKIEKVSETVAKAIKIASQLKNNEIMNFLRRCANLNTADITAKKSMETRSSKGRLSLRSTRMSSEDG